MFAEPIVAARERDIDLEPSRHQPFAWAGRAIDPNGFVAGGLFATQTGEELVEVVDDRHDGTAVNDMSPVCTHAPRYAHVGTGWPARTGSSAPITRSGVHGSTS